MSKSKDLTEPQKFVIKRLKEGYILRKYGNRYLLHRNITHSTCEKIYGVTVRTLLDRKLIKVDTLGITFTLIESKSLY